MSGINSRFLKEIRLALNSTRFSDNDFILDDTGYNEILRIKFKYDDDFYFSFKEEEVTEQISDGKVYGLNTKTYSQTVTKRFTHESPGEYKQEDKIVISEYSDVTSRISIWCQNIHREMENDVVFNSEFEAEKKAFRETIAISLDDPDSRFSSEELESLEVKLDTLLSKVTELSEKYENSQAEIQSLKDEIETIKDNAKTYTKGVWAVMTENKLTNFVFEFLKSKEGRNLLVESIKKIGTGM